MATWIVLDVPCLAYRYFYKHGHLQHDGKGSSVAYGIFRDLLRFEDLFCSSRFVFCFDTQKNLRRKIYPEYKAQRQDFTRSPEEAAKRLEFFRQLEELRTRQLFDLGYRNVYWQDGYEADDMIASVCEGLSRTDRAMLVSSDNDLWQLLARNVRIWSVVNKEVLTANAFREEWGISPTQWADVKALAGCQSDNVKGVRLVGNRKAAAYLAGNLPNGKAYQNIVAGNDIWRRNLELVRLPFAGTREIQLQEDNTSPDKWRSVLRKLGIKSLRV